MPENTKVTKSQTSHDDCTSRSAHTYKDDEAAIVSNEYVLVSSPLRLGAIVSNRSRPSHTGLC
jgi:hypothetical protein